MKTHLNQSGYSLIEVLIALTILMIAIVAPITIAIKSLESSTYSLEQNTALFLAQESISLIEAARNQNALENINAEQFEARGPYWGEWAQVFIDRCVVDAEERISGCNFDATEMKDFVTDPSSFASRIRRCTELGNNCRLHYNPEWTHPVYRLETDEGELSPYLRRVFVDRGESNNVLIIRVEVEWQSKFLRETQSVSLTSVLYNIYGTLVQ